MLNLSRSVYRYRPDTNRDLPVIAAIQAVLEIHPGYGFGKLFKTLRRQGYRWNHKRVYRVYCLLKLNKRRKGKAPTAWSSSRTTGRATDSQLLLVGRLHE